MLTDTNALAKLDHKNLEFAHNQCVDSQQAATMSREEVQTGIITTSSSETAPSSYTEEGNAPQP
jgi:hypothetical protein